LVLTSHHEHSLQLVAPICTGSSFSLCGAERVQGPPLQRIGLPKAQTIKTKLSHKTNNYTTQQKQRTSQITRSLRSTSGTRTFDRSCPNSRLTSFVGGLTTTLRITLRLRLREGFYHIKHAQIVRANRHIRPRSNNNNASAKLKSLDSVEFEEFFALLVARHRIPAESLPNSC
jgi:hypothetical protein